MLDVEEKKDYRTDENTPNILCWVILGTSNRTNQGKIPVAYNWSVPSYCFNSKVNSFVQFLTRLNIELPYDSDILLPDIHPREMKTYAHVKICTQIFIADYS